MRIGNHNPGSNEPAKSTGAKQGGDASRARQSRTEASSGSAQTAGSERPSGRIAREDEVPEEIAKLAAYEAKAAAAEARAAKSAADGESPSAGNGRTSNGEATSDESSPAKTSERPSNVDEYGVVRRRAEPVELNDAILRLQDVVAVDLIHKANESRGSSGIRDLARLVADGNRFGGPDAEAEIRAVVERPAGNAAERLRAKWMATETKVPQWVAQGGFKAHEISGLAASWQFLGGQNPAQMTPGFVSFHDNGFGRATVDQLQGWVAKIDGINQSDPTLGVGESSGFGAGPMITNDGALGPAGPDLQVGGGDPPKPTTPNGPRGNSSFSERGERAVRGGGDSGVPATETAAASYTVTDVVGNSDGTITYAFTREGGNDGRDGEYTTTYDQDDDGNWFYTVWETATGAFIDGGEGEPPSGVKAGDSTTKVDDDEAIYSKDATTDSTEQNGTAASESTDSTESQSTDASDGSDGSNDAGETEGADSSSDEESTNSSESSVGTSPVDSEGSTQRHSRDWVPITTAAQRGVSGEDGNSPDDRNQDRYVAPVDLDPEVVTARTHADNPLLVNPTRDIGAPSTGHEGAPGAGVSPDSREVNPDRGA